MNINGNKVIFEKGNIAVADTRRGYVVYKNMTTKNGDGTAFKWWDAVETFDDEDAAIEFARDKILKEIESEDE